MSYGPNAVYTLSMASGATLTGAVDLGRAWINNLLVIQSMNSNSQIHLQGSDSLTGTYRRIKHPTINSSTVGTNDYTIHSSASNAIVPIPAGVRFLKVETTATVDNGCIFKVICGA